MKKNKTIKIILITMILIVIVGLITFTTVYYIKQIKLNYELEDITDYNYSILYKDNRYGVINKYGEVIIEAKYTNIQIPNPSKPVFICTGEYVDSLGEYENKVLNDKKEQILTTYDKVSAISIEATDGNIPYEKSVLIYKKDKKYGLIDFDGKEITNPIYDEISSIKYKEGTLLVKSNDKYGVININGAEIIKPKYDSISSDNYYTQTDRSKKAGFIVSQTTEQGYRYGYINYKGKRILKTEYNKIERVNEIQEKDVYLIAYKNGQAGIMKNDKSLTNYEFENIEYNLNTSLFIVKRNSKDGVINKNGDFLINTDYDEISFAGEYITANKNEDVVVFDLSGNKIENNNIINLTKTSDGLYYIAIDKENNYTILDLNKTELIKDKYEYIEYIDNGNFIVSKDKKSGVINNTGNQLLKVEYDTLLKVYGTKLIQAYNNDTETTILFDENFNEIDQMKDAEIEVKDKYIILYSDSNFKYYSYDGKKIESRDVYTENNLFAYNQDGKWGFTDKFGQIVIKCEYEMVTEINEYGYAGIRKDGVWGSIDSNGNIVQEPIYKLKTNRPTFIGKFYKIESWTGENCYSDNQEQEEANNGESK